MSAARIFLLSTYMAVLFFPYAVFAAHAKVGGLFNSVPTCSDPTSVWPAQRAFFKGDTLAIARLGCLVAVPDGIRIRVLRCEAGISETSLNEIGYPVDLDASLPIGVCEIDVLWLERWRGTLFTFHHNIRSALP